MAVADSGLHFDQPDITKALDCLQIREFDALPFGVIALDQSGIVVAYNAAEAVRSRLTPERTIGRHFFTAVAPCCNNYMVAHRFETEPELDATIDYVFTFKMAPQPVRLRLLRHPNAYRMYLLVDWD
jgi:photoactive yellow protein